MPMVGMAILYIPYRSWCSEATPACKDVPFDLALALARAAKPCLSFAYAGSSIERDASRARIGLYIAGFGAEPAPIQPDERLWPPAGRGSRHCRDPKKLGLAR
jgi:hypothetical protein